MTGPIQNTLQTADVGPGFFKNRRGLYTGIVYAVVSLVLTSVCIHNSSAGNKIGEVLRVFLWPGGLPFLFVSKHAMAGGVYVLFYITNPAVYFICGFILGALSNSFRKIIFISLILLLGMSGTGYYSGITLPHIKQEQSLLNARESALAKLKVDPNDVYSLHWMGLDYFKRRDKPFEAEEYFRKIIQIESSAGSVSSYGQRSLMYLAIINQRLGKPEEAAVCFKKFMESNPKMDNVEIGYVNEYRQNIKSPKSIPK